MARRAAAKKARAGGSEQQLSPFSAIAWKRLANQLENRLGCGSKARFFKCPRRLQRSCRRAGKWAQEGLSCPASPIKEIERVTVDILWTPDGKRV